MKTKQYTKANKTEMKNYLEQTMSFGKISVTKKTEMLFHAVRLNCRKKNIAFPSKDEIKNFKDRDELLLEMLEGGKWIDYKRQVKVNLWVHFHKMKNNDLTTQKKLFKKCKQYGLIFTEVCKEPVMDYVTQFFLWSKIKKELNEVRKTLCIDTYKYMTPEKFSPIVKKSLMEFYQRRKTLVDKESDIQKHFDNAEHLRHGGETVSGYEANETFHYCDDMKNQQMWNWYFKRNKE